MATSSILTVASLVLSIGPPVCEKREPDPELQQIELEYEEAVEKWMQKHEELDEARESSSQPCDLFELEPKPTDVVAPKLKAYIHKHASDAKAFRGLETLLTLTNRFQVVGQTDEHAMWALEMVISDYASHPQVVDVLGAFRFQQVPRERIKHLYKKVIRVHKDRETVAGAKLFLGVECSGEPVAQDGEKGSEERARGEAIIRELAKTDPDTKAGKAAARYVYGFDHLQIGMVAPDIQGPGVDGEVIRLSDFRGQVVVVEFWRNWIFTPRARLPHGPGFAERFKGRPVTILGVGNDRDLPRLQKALKDNKVTWPCIHDGGQGRTIAKRWNAGYGPTTYIIDHEGVIRNRGLSGPAMDKAVEDLLEGIP